MKNKITLPILVLSSLNCFASERSDICNFKTKSHLLSINVFTDKRYGIIPNFIVVGDATIKLLNRVCCCGNRKK